MNKEELLLRELFGYPQGFVEELTALINKYNLEDKSSTPDFLMARFMCESLKNFENRSLERDKEKK
jgi:hypothetical protein